jgi:8-oxo-dGTP pyrophosphatase MutT (NUDIX family)
MVEEAEDVLSAAQRELLEETGYSGKKWKQIGGVIHENPTKSVNESFWYVVTDIERVQDQHLDANEEIEVLRVPAQELLKKIQHGDVIAGPTIGSFLFAFLELGYLQFV